LSFGQWAYGDTPVIVLSQNNVNIPKEISKTVSCSSECPKELSARLEFQGAKKIYVDGGAIIQSFLKEDLIRDITITRVPIIIGKGMSLFGKLDHNDPTKSQHLFDFFDSYNK
jgi:dihydrofolate reductase